MMMFSRLPRVCKIDKYIPRAVEYPCVPPKMPEDEQKVFRIKRLDTQPVSVNSLKSKMGRVVADFQLQGY